MKPVSLAARWVAGDWQRGRWWLPPAFFVAVALLVPFAIGADRRLLTGVGGGIAWLAALLAALLPAESLWSGPGEEGQLDQLRLAGLSDETVAAARLAAAWVALAVPLLASLVVVVPLLALSPAQGWRLGLALIAGTPGLAALAVLTGALTLGRGRVGGLTAAVMLPLAVPLLIFGAGAVAGRADALALTGATSAVLVAIAPFAAGAALRASRR